MLGGVRTRASSAFFSVIRAITAPRSAAGRGLVDSAWGRRFRGILWGLLQEGLSSEGKSRLGIALYDAGEQYRDAPRYAWEDAWIERWIPRISSEAGERGGGTSSPSGARSVETPSPSGARVLVGAAGAGREVIAMRERGYEVIAIEPSARLAALCRDRVREREGTSDDAHSSDAPGVTVIEARYEEIEASGERPPAGDARAFFVRRAARLLRTARAASGLRPPAAAAREIGRVDAVILGLGSLSHVLDAQARTRLFEVLSEVCPDGPILASALGPPKGMSIEEARREGRAAKIGRRIGARLREARGLSAVDEGEIVFDALGFAKLFTRDELIAIGEAAGRRTIFEEGAPDGMWLCAFVPR